MSINMTAKHARWPKTNDVIFGLAGQAAEAIKEYGKENVINSTIGALIDDDGNLITMKTVFDQFKALPNAEISAYAALAGQPDFLEAVQIACFREYKPDAYIKAVATPGGTGAIKHAVWNYTNPGDEVLTSDWYWSPYNTITEEVDRKIRTYTLFNEKNEFNIDSFKENFNSLVEKQKRVLTLINTPAHNPTGYSLSDDEWVQVLNIMKDAAKDEDNRIIVFVDAAYIDFAGNGSERRKFFKLFENLPQNILIIVGYSMSKGYTMYGLRSGAAICISSSEDVAEEFHYACLHSGRANWSNGNRGAMATMTTIANDKKILQAYEEEKLKYKTMLQERAKAFVEAADEAGLELLPYRDGFFISIPCDNPMEACQKLVKENLFVVPLKMGLRFAVCAVSEDKCRKAPVIIKKALR